MQKMLQISGNNRPDGRFLVILQRKRIYKQIHTTIMRKQMRILSLIAVMASASSLAVSANSPYISRVLEFVPAPGQFVNYVPEISPEDSRETVCAKVLEQIGHGKTPGMVSLGAYGGYVVFGFDHPVVNVKGSHDFRIYGNATLAAPGKAAGSCEPGIVMVSRDTNGNGIADDAWYELAGSDYAKETTLKGYRITYYRPSADHTAEPHPTDKSIVDAKYIRWTASDGSEGHVERNRFHDQSYWPEWIEAETLVFEGTRLAPNGEDVNGNGSYFELRMLDWGYADNRPNGDQEEKGFDIAWAVDADGNAVDLAAIDFVKVYTAVNQTNGWIGETSTEICGAEDLHPDAQASGSGVEEAVAETGSCDAAVYDLFGRSVAVPSAGQICIREGKKFVAK